MTLEEFMGGGAAVATPKRMTLKEFMGTPVEPPSVAPDEQLAGGGHTADLVPFMPQSEVYDPSQDTPEEFRHVAELDGPLTRATDAITGAIAPVAPYPYPVDPAGDAAQIRGDVKGYRERTAQQTLDNQNESIHQNRLAQGDPEAIYEENRRRNQQLKDAGVDIYRQNLKQSADMDQANRGAIRGSMPYRIAESAVNAAADAIANPLLAVEGKLGITGADEALQTRQASREADDLRDKSWLESQAKGIADSLAQSTTLAATGGLPGIIAGFGYNSYSTAKRQAILDGKTEDEATKIARSNAAFEMGVMSILQLVGLGGLEKETLGGFQWKGVKNFAVQSLAELSEEELTTLGQNLASTGDVGDPKSFIDTAIQTIGTMGLVGGSEKIRDFVSKPSAETAAAANIPPSVVNSDKAAEALAKKITAGVQAAAQKYTPEEVAAMQPEERAYHGIEETPASTAPTVPQAAAPENPTQRPSSPESVQPDASPAATEQQPNLPEPAPGTVRFYHGGDPNNKGKRWFSPDPKYAEAYAAKSDGAQVSYIDLPADSPLLRKSYDDSGLDIPAPYISFEAPADIAQQAKPIEQPPSSPSVAPPGNPSAPVSTAAPEGPGVERTDSSLNSDQTAPAIVPPRNTKEPWEMTEDEWEHERAARFGVTVEDMENASPEVKAGMKARLRGVVGGMVGATHEAWLNAKGAVDFVIRRAKDYAFRQRAFGHELMHALEHKLGVANFDGLPDGYEDIASQLVSDLEKTNPDRTHAEHHQQKEELLRTLISHWIEDPTGNGRLAIERHMPALAEKLKAEPLANDPSLYDTHDTLVHDALRQGKPVPQEIEDAFRKRTGIGLKKRIGQRKEPAVTITTQSGREIPSPPQIRTTSNAVAGKDYRSQHQWLLDQGIAEAEARGDEYNLNWMRGEKLSKPSKRSDGGLPQATVDSLNEYLFGETDPQWEQSGSRIESGIERSQQPPVLPKITKPLVEQPAPTKKPAAESQMDRLKRERREQENARNIRTNDGLAPDAASGWLDDAIRRRPSDRVGNDPQAIADWIESGFSNSNYWKLAKQEGKPLAEIIADRMQKKPAAAPPKKTIGQRKKPALTADQYREQVRKSALKPEEADAIIAITEHRAAAEGETLDEYLKRRRYTTVEQVDPSQSVYLKQLAAGKIKNELTGDARGGEAMAQPAYHGSPYKFDKFTTDRIGTGEGAQAFGHGLYFAGNKAVADFYRQKLADPGRMIQQKAIEEYDQGSDPAEAADALMSRTDLTPAERNLLESLQKDDWLGFDYPHQAVKAAMAKDFAARFDASPETLASVERAKKESGATYKVDLKPTNDELIDWDKTFDEQSDGVKKLVKAANISWPKHQTGEDFYRGLEIAVHEPNQGHLDKAKASQHLNAIGIRGIKYLDEVSRNKGTFRVDGYGQTMASGFKTIEDAERYIGRQADKKALKVVRVPHPDATSNFVIFDDADVAIEEVLAQRKAKQESGGVVRGETVMGSSGVAIRAFTGSQNLSTLLHETFHPFIEDVGRQHPKDLATLEKWLGAKKGEWTREHHEKWARGGERYFRDGKAPTTALAKVFRLYKSWLSKIYRKIKGSEIDINIPPAMRRVYDNLFLPKTIGQRVKAAPVTETVQPATAPTEPKLTKREANKINRRVAKLQDVLHEDDFAELSALSPEDAAKVFESADDQAKISNVSINELIDDFHNVFGGDGGYWTQQVKQREGKGRDAASIEGFDLKVDAVESGRYPTLRNSAMSRGDGDVEHGLFQILLDGRRVLESRRVKGDDFVTDALEDYRGSINTGRNQAASEQSGRDDGFGPPDAQASGDEGVSGLPSGEGDGADAEDFQLTGKPKPVVKPPVTFESNDKSKQGAFITGIDTDLPGQETLFDPDEVSDDGDTSFDPSSFGDEGPNSNYRGNADRTADGAASFTGTRQASTPKEAKVTTGIPVTLKPIPLVEMVRVIRAMLGDKMPVVIKRMGALGYFTDRGGPGIKINAALAEDPHALAGVLAHEFGHLNDYLPEGTLKRGNILGRIASLKGYLKHWLEGQPGGQPPLSKADRERLRRLAEKMTSGTVEREITREITQTMPVTAKDIINIWNLVDQTQLNPELLAYVKGLSTAEKLSIVKEAMKGVVSDDLQRFAQKIGTGKFETFKEISEVAGVDVSKKYRELIEEEIRKRELLSRDTITKELKGVSAWWRGPFGPKDAYRNSSKELYADAVSVLFNSPGDLQERAPMFFRGFLGYLDAKPEFRAEYLSIQDLLNGTPEQLAENRRNDIREMFGKGEEIWKARHAEREDGKQNVIAYLRQSLFDKSMPILTREKHGAEPWSEANAAKHALEEFDMAKNALHLWVGDVHDQVTAPLEKAGVSRVDAGEYMMMTRIAEGDRGGSAEAAQKMIMGITGKPTWAEAKADYVNTLLANSNKPTDELLEQAMSGKINPSGYTPEHAREYLADLKKRLGPQAHAALENAIAKYHDLQWKVVEEAAKVGSYNRQMVDEVLRPNKDFYAPFAVLKYLDAKVKAGIFKQVGTFEDIANPFDASLMKTMSLIRLNELQKAKLAVEELLESTGEIGPVQRIDKHHRLKPPQAGKEHLWILKDGKPTAREVDPYIARVFANHDIGSLGRLARWLGSSYRVFHPFWIGYNIGWQAKNLIRDPSRTYTNSVVLKAGDPMQRQVLSAFLDIGKVGVAYVKAIPPSWRRAFGWSDPLIRQMQEERALTTPFVKQRPGDEDIQYDKMLKEAGVWEKPASRRRIVRMLEAAANGVENFGVFTETLSKVVMYQAAEKKGMGTRERAYVVRNYAGTPNTRRRGLWVDVSNSVWMYSNVVLQGYRADAEVAVNPTTASGRLVRAALTQYLPKVAMMAAAAGLAGQWLKDFYKDVPEYDKTKYIIIPLGRDENGKPVYLRIPHNDTDRVIAGAMWKLAHRQNPTEAMDLALGDLPGLNPFLQMASKWGQYLSGKNPRDDFRNRDIIGRDEQTVGGWARLKPMVLWTTDQTGELGHAIRVVAEWNKNSYNQEPTSTTEKIINSIPGVSALVKVSDRGKTEEDWAAIDEEDRVAAENRLGLPAEARNATKTLNRLQRLRGRESADEDQRLLLQKWMTQSYLPITKKIGETSDESVRTKLRDQLAESSKDLKGQYTNEVAKDQAEIAIAGDGHPKRKLGEKPDAYAARVKEWKADESAARAWLTAHKDSPEVQQAITAAEAKIKRPTYGQTEESHNSYRKRRALFQEKHSSGLKFLEELK